MANADTRASGAASNTTLPVSGKVDTPESSSQAVFERRRLAVGLFPKARDW